MDDTTWKIGEVAETSGLTVRTLHHWDSIGLLTPSRRGPGGHREYTADDLGRLYLILTLRGLGLSLEEIGDCLDAGADPAELLATHLAQIDETLAALHDVRARVATLSESLSSGSDPTSGLVEVLGAMGRLRPSGESILTQHLDAEQLDVLRNGSTTVGRAREYLHQVVWPHLYRQVDELRRAGASPADARVQRLVGRMAELGAAATGGREDVSRGVRAAWRDDPAALSGQDDAPVDEWRDLADFVERARALHA